MFRAVGFFPKHLSYYTKLNFKHQRMNSVRDVSRVLPPGDIWNLLGDRDSGQVGTEKHSEESLGV